MNTLPYSFITIVLIYIFKFIYKRLMILEITLKDRFQMDRLEFGLLSKYALSKISHREFEQFCNYFSTTFYNNIKKILEDTEGGITYSALTDEGEEIYIYCYQARSNTDTNNNDSYTHLGRPSLQKLIGSMVKDNITSAMLITNGEISEEAADYLRKLPKKYNIDIHTGSNLSKECWKIRNKKVKNTLQLEMAKSN